MGLEKLRKILILLGGVTDILSHHLRTWLASKNSQWKIEVESFTKEATEPIVLLTEETENIEVIPGNPDKTII